MHQMVSSRHQMVSYDVYINELEDFNANMLFAYSITKATNRENLFRI